MVELKRRYFPDVSLRDLRTTIGVVLICQRSGSLLYRASERTHDMQISRALREAAKKRVSLARQIIPKTELEKPAVASIENQFEREISMYGDLEERIASEEDLEITRRWVEEFHSADLQVLRRLRSITRTVESRSLATRLSALVATYWLSSEKLFQKYVCRPTALNAQGLY